MQQQNLCKDLGLGALRRSSQEKDCQCQKISHCFQCQSQAMPILASRNRLTTSLKKLLPSWLPASSKTATAVAPKRLPANARGLFVKLGGWQAVRGGLGFCTSRSGRCRSAR